jgi:lipoprotein-anchoring transpeptidase ErfK/SrfK
MPFRHGDALRTTARRHAASTAGLLALCLVAAGCSSKDADHSATPQSDGSKAASGSSSSSSASASPASPGQSAATVSFNLRHRDVKVDKIVKLTAKDGTFDSVAVRSGGKTLAGSLNADKTTWTASERLEPDTRYRVRTVAVDSDGAQAVKRSSFRTESLTLDQQTFPSFAPVKGETVGVGMPVIVRFDVPVRNKASIERHLTVTNTSNQQGAWRWISDSEVHWRPATYWKPGTDVTVKADINSIPAGNGVYGQLNRTSTFHVGRSMVSRVNAKTHTMKTFINGKLARTTPITTGKAGFTTRSGTKVIIEKFRHKRMNSETVGIAVNSANGYDIGDVEYAMRVTYSGEFLHAAPWSVGSQGHANVSHGCTGMSTANAAWIYDRSKPGDVVEYTGTDRHMTLDNGYGDWNESFTQWKTGSALS